MSDTLTLITAFLGLLLLCLRMWPRPRLAPRSEKSQQVDSPMPKVSVILPVRNEEANLPLVLLSLQKNDYPNLEIIVVDDDSKDRSLEVVQTFGYKVVKAGKRPNGWLGKQWACLQGAKVASGDILLFTDADTRHDANAIRRAVDFFISNQADLVSSIPTYCSELWWEKLLGPFHVLFTALFRPFSDPRIGHLFAKGQFLMFRREFYFKKLGTHEAVKGTYVEDIPLANVTIERGGRYLVYFGKPLFKVRMYSTLIEFINGWRRRFRAEFKYTSPVISIELVLMLSALFGAGMWGSGWGFMLLAASWTFMGFAQGNLGEFSPLGALLMPFSVALFLVVLFLASFDTLLRRDMIWRGRAYSQR